MQSVNHTPSVLTQAAEQSQNTATTMDTVPVPLSFPAILRNRYAHLRPPGFDREAISRSQSNWARKDRNVFEGKRWVRRQENGMFTVPDKAFRF